MQLSTEQQILVEHRLAFVRKSVGIAYLYWLFIGGLGGHRFYLGRSMSALALLGLSVFGWVTLTTQTGTIALVAVGLWLLVDAFLIPAMIRKDTDKRRSLIEAEIAAAPASRLPE
ncbi:MAG: TM2 domain-containing protein [Jhaorihella sp.]